MIYETTISICAMSLWQKTKKLAKVSFHGSTGDSIIYTPMEPRYEARMENLYLEEDMLSIWASSYTGF